MNPRDLQQVFLDQLDGVQPFRQLLDMVPDVAFFMKDRQGRFIMLNRRATEYCLVASELEAIGKTDHDFFPKDRADKYASGDEQVMMTGDSIIGAIDLAPEKEGSDRLIVFSKIPLRNRQGKIIGVAGIHREIEGMRATPTSYGRFSRAIEYLHTHYSQPVTTRQLARKVGISISQFDRQFRKLFSTTLHQYLVRLRLQAAIRLLTIGEKSITEVAMEVGFYDHAHFTRTFTKLMGIAPLAYRKQYQSE
jgi:PAS domain S-box-containing protein